MSEPDLVLLHAPSVYDFRQEAILYGPLADFVPVPYVFELFPLGYSSLAEYIERAGYRVHVLNLARHMLDDPLFDAEDDIAALSPIAFLIDLHWLSHAQGTLAVAQIVKTVNPQTPIIFEGYAAAYYHRELMNYPQVDYVLRNESVETSLLGLVKCLDDGRPPEAVPGLTWRTRSGEVIENPIAEEPLVSLDDLPVGGGGWSFTCQPNHYPTTGVLARRCGQNCLICGGSAYAYQRLYGQHEAEYRSPERLAHDLGEVSRHNGAVYIPGDITLAGMDYAYRFLQAMQGFPHLVCLDLFKPVPRKYLQDVANALPYFALQITMGSHDPQVRGAIGRGYSNPAMEQTIADALSLGCAYIDLQFTIGLPGQDHNSVMATVDYGDDLLSRIRDGGRLRPFIAPLAPFLDPGSIVFEEPQQSGYHLLYHSFEEHRRALLAPSWKHVLNYETEWMSRDDIARATYDAAVGMARVRARHGLIPPDYVQELETQVEQTYQLMDEIDHLLAEERTDQLHETLRTLKPEIDKLNRAGLWYNWPVGGPACQRIEYDFTRRTSRGAPDVWRALKGWWRRAKWRF